MALSDERLREIEREFNAERVRTSDEEYLVIYPSDYWQWQRAMEAEVRKEYDALVRQMLEAMSNLKTLCLSGGSPLFTAEFDRFIEATTAARARLEENTNT